MSISKSINEENNISQKEHIYNFLTLEKCEDAGLIIEDFKDNILNLGAMNLGYIKVKKLIKELEDKFEIEIKIKQITSLEWESWFEQNYSTSVENIQKKSTSSNNQFLENDFEQYNESLLKETINTEPTKPISSPAALKIKSVCCSGINCKFVNLPFRRPVPNNPPEPIPILLCNKW